MEITLGISENLYLNKPISTLVSGDFTDPELIGPDKLCNVFGSIIGDFYGAGDPLTDVYSWKIFGPSGQLLFDRSGGAGFQTISFTFSFSGTHKVELEVSRGVSIIYSESKDVELIEGPKINLLPSYEICGLDPLELIAIDPNSPNFNDYQFIWRNSAGDTIGTNNTIEVTSPDSYSVELFFEENLDEKACETTLNTDVTTFSDYQVLSSANEICPDQLITFETSPAIGGDWYFEFNGAVTKTLLGRGSKIIVNPILQLEESGTYNIFFVPYSQIGNSCLTEKSLTIEYFPQPEFTVIDSKSATACFISDGSLTIQAITPMNGVIIDGLGLLAPPLDAGDTYTFTGLESGAYTMIATLGSCTNFFGSVVSLQDPPETLKFEVSSIQGEQCLPDGKTKGEFQIEFTNGPIDGSYRIINEKGAEIENTSFINETLVDIIIPGGKYYFELYGPDSCSLPKAEFIEIPALDLTAFSVPDFLNVCQSYELRPETDQELLFELQYPDGTIETKTYLESFIITEAGKYKLIGSLPGQGQICPSSKEFEVYLVDPVEFEPILIQQDCFGNRTYFADINGRDPSTVVFYWYNENDELIGRGQSMFPTTIGEFKLDVQPANSTTCPFPPKEFLIKEPILEVDVTLTSTKLCELGPGAFLSLESTFPEEITDIIWRKYDISGEIQVLDEFKDQSEITVFEDGIYEASVYSIIPSIGKDCELGRNSLELNFTTERVEFEVPDSLSICEPYDLIPETDQSLEFILTYPDGSTVENIAGSPFTINQTGNYSMYGYHPEISSPNCPEIKEFSVIVNDPIPFTPILFSEDCLGQKIYQARLTGANAEDASFFWYDENGNLIGTKEFLTLDGIFGTFSLEVQPINSLPCDIQPIEFEVPEPILSLDVTLLTAPFCPDAPNSLITLETDFEEVSTIEWWFTDLNGNLSELVNQKNQPEILAINEGTYEARVFNNLPCLLGSDLVLVMRSMDQVRPEVKEIYQICPKYDIAPVINPGSFSVYEWYHEGTLVSTSPTFKPLLIGNFELIVYSDEGCPYSTTFVTEEECELKVVYPNAIELGNPDKEFLIYTNYLIDEIEVYIFNKWGQVVFQCIQTNLITEESTCSWDGTFQGKSIPNGSYAVRLNYKNLEKGIYESHLGSILVIK